VIAAKPLTRPAICRYLDTRRIPYEIANKHCEEVEFKLKNMISFAGRFENNLGGSELRNEDFKCSDALKNITVIKHNNNRKNMPSFECFFCNVFKPNCNTKSILLTDKFPCAKLAFILFKKSGKAMEKFDTIHLYLNCDSRGKKHMLQALQWLKKLG
jgi:hypothetical protein